MKGYAKIRLAVFLCIMMVLPSILSVLPMATQEVSAAQELNVGWFYDISRHENTPIQIEKGAKFYVGDYAYISDGDLYGTATLYAKATYSSSKKGVASVNSKGLLTAKKAGITTIKIKYKGKTISANFMVVNKGSLSDSAAAKGLQQAIDKVKNSMPSEITKSNALKYTKIENTYISAAGKYASDITSSGFLMEEIKDGNYSYTSASCKLAVPDAGRYYYLDYLLYRYSDKNSPTSTRSSKAMKIASVSANSNQITVKVKKAVTVDQILAANIQNSSYNKNPNKKSAVAYVMIYDQTAQENYTGLATITKGSKVVKIKLVKFGWVDDVWTGTTQKLQKGHTYAIGAKDLSWGNGKTVKIK